MKLVKPSTLQLKTRTLLTFESKPVRKERAFMDTDPTTTTLPTTSTGFPIELLKQVAPQEQD